MYTNRKGIKRWLAWFMTFCLIFTSMGVTAFGAEPPLKSIDIGSLKAGEIGAATNNIQMIECGHEFSFDLSLKAAFNSAVLDTTSKKPYDVVLVFDASGSMANTNQGGSAAKWSAAKAAAKAVISVVDDYNKGNGEFAGTGAFTAGQGSRFAFVPYDTNAGAMTPVVTGTGNSARFTINTNTAISSGTTYLFDPAGITGTNSNRTMAERAIDNLAAGSYTNIADGIRNANAILAARGNVDRPGFIIVMSDGVANRPYQHGTGTTTVNSGNYNLSGNNYVKVADGTGRYNVEQGALVTSGNGYQQQANGDWNRVSSGSRYNLIITDTRVTPNHSTVTINGIRIVDKLATLGIDVTSTTHQCNATEPNTHCCPTAAAVLRADESRAAGHTVFAVGFELTGINDANARNVAAETLRMIAGNGQTDGKNDNYFAPNMTAELSTVFTNIVKENITVEINPVATDGLVTYNAPDGFTIVDVKVLSIAGGGMISKEPVIAADKKSFTLEIDEIFAKTGKVEVKIKAAESVEPGKYLVIGDDSSFEFTNVALNLMTGGVPVKAAWYSDGTGEFDFYIDLADWANKYITVLPLAKDAGATVANLFPTDREFEISYSDLSNSPYSSPEGFSLKGSGDVKNTAGNKIGTFVTTAGGALKVTLDNPIGLEDITATLTYSVVYTKDGVSYESCESKTLTINVSVKDTYTVTVNYFVKNIGGSYTKLSSRTVVDAGYLPDDAYALPINGADATDSINFQGRAYYFDFGENVNTDAFITNAANKADLSGVIDPEDEGYGDVVINLYYSKLALPEITLKKFVEKFKDAKYPSSYEFTFALYLSNGAKVTEDLTFSKSDVEKRFPESKAFVWDVAGINIADLRGAELFIKETAGSGWSSDAIGSPVLYGKFDHLLNFQPDEDFENSSVKNIFRQDQIPPTIELRKFFKGDGAELLPEFDGAVLSCGDTERPESEAVFGDVWMVCGEDGCEEDNCPLGDDCTGVLLEDQEITPADLGHTHGNSCYAYEFTFEIYYDDVKAGEKDILIFYDDLLELLADSSKFESIFFDVALEDLPEPGSGKVLSISIVEKNNNYGWVAETEISGIVVDPYGKVTYPRIRGQKVDYAVMKNVFNGIKIPSFSFTKTVVDARGILSRPIVEYYSGDFTFELSDGEEFTLTVENGIATETVELPQYIGKDVTLTLTEQIPADMVPGMTYDTRPFTIVIENGVVTKVNPVGRHDKTPIVFVNTLLEPIDPVVKVEKIVNGTETVKADFTFNWSYEGFKNDDLLSPAAVDGNGTETIKVNDGVDQSFTIELPRNFTGKLTITEDTSAPMENWIYDKNNVRTITYFLGNPVGKKATNSVSFTNNYYEAKIELTKEASKESAVLYDKITYTIMVQNTGAEELKNVVISDEMFKKAINGEIKLFVPGVPSEVELIEDVDYEIDLTAGTITLLNNLEPLDKFFIRYSVAAAKNDDGEVVPIVNEAFVTAERVVYGGTVNDDDKVTIPVTEYQTHLKVKKQVAAYTESMDYTAGSVVWNDTSITFTSSGNKAVFKITITNDEERALYITQITDFFNGIDVSGGKFYYNGGEYNLAALISELSSIPLSGGGSVVFYYITDALATRATYTNVVTVKAVDENQVVHEGKDEAAVVLSWNTTPDNDDPRDRDPDDPPVTINTPPVPLATIPDEPVVIFDEQVPLADIPQTGINDNLISFLLFGLSLIALAALRITRRREEN